MIEIVYVCEEMKKFRDALDKKGISWSDDSNGGEAWMCRTAIKVGRKRYTAINGYGSWGGLSPKLGVNRGLLECWDHRKDHEPVGMLTAEQAMEYCGFGGE